MTRSAFPLAVGLVLGACTHDGDESTALDAASATTSDGGARGAPSSFDAAPGPRDAAPDAMANPDGAASDAADVPDAATRRPRPARAGMISAITSERAPTLPLSGPVSPEERGFVVEELLLAGVATAYEPAGEQTLDGRWGIQAASQAPYVTRVVVHRPKDAAAFNGTLIVEWLNVTGQVDTAVGYVFAWEELLRGGYAYAAVSVQKAGVDALKLADGERYAALVHPGDTYAYDIFDQAGAALGWPDTFDALRGLSVERVVAYGMSQSAMRMITQLNAFEPVNAVYDGVIIHSRAGWGAPVGTESDALVGTGLPVHVRADTAARVLQLFTESELFLLLGPAYGARQPDSDHLRTWELAGAAHADQHMVGALDLGCGGAINAGQGHAVIKAGIHAMHFWLKDGDAPPRAEPIAVNGTHDGIARDELGLARGGVRTPAVDVPTAMLTGAPSDLLGQINPMCMLTGQTIPFGDEQLLALYPTHDEYVERVKEAARSAREKRFILPEEEASLVAEAEAAAIPPVP